MPDRSAKRLARIHRVRTLQLDLVRADEARARERVASETALSHRIADLAGNVAPTANGSAQSAVTLLAAAHYRDRLHQSAAAAERRVAQAEQGLVEASARAHAAKRDQTAVEKLVERAEARAAQRAMRALEDAPATMKKNRHDPC